MMPIGSGGTVLAGLTAPPLANAYGLAAPFILAAVLIGAMAVVFMFFGRDAPDFVPTKGSVSQAFAVFRTSSRAWALTLMYFVTFGGFVAMFLYLPRILVSVYELSKSDAGARAAGFALLAVLARPVGGMLADRFGAERSVCWATPSCGQRPQPRC
jgi:NNP family nitrate/nitrite transporter-like MFS transporter